MLRIGTEDTLKKVREGIRAGKWDWAESVCRTALAGENPDPRFMTCLGILAAKDARLEHADALLDMAFKLLAPGAGIRAGLTREICQATDPDLALRLIRRLVDRHGDHPCLRPWSREPGHWSAACLAGPNQPAPWPAMNEFQARAVLAALGTVPRPAQVLEWGSGNSTLYFGSKLGKGANWCAIEHDREWFEYVSAEAANVPGAEIEIRHVAATGPLEHPHDDGDSRTFGRYIDFPASLDREFGFILVDGRARVECLRSGWELLHPAGIMALHDSEREEYRSGYPGTEFHVALSFPSLREGTGIDFFMKSEEVFDTFSSALKGCLPRYVAVELSPSGACGAIPCYTDAPESL